LRGQTGGTGNVRLGHPALLSGGVEGPNDSVDSVDPAALEGIPLGELRILHPAIEVSVELSLHAPLRV
jgi:hypothetical protein